MIPWIISIYCICGIVSLIFFATNIDIFELYRLKVHYELLIIVGAVLFSISPLSVIPCIYYIYRYTNKFLKYIFGKILDKIFNVKKECLGCKTNQGNNKCGVKPRVLFKRCPCLKCLMKPICENACDKHAYYVTFVTKQKK